MREEAKQVLDDLERKGVIRKVTEPREWTHAMTLVRKRNGKLRPCIDMRNLNKYVMRPHFPINTPKDAISTVPPDAKYFSVFDASNGYYQVPLDEESKKLTCFITPFCRYELNRGAQGLSCTGDEYNRRNATSLEKIPNARLVVDDVLGYTVSPEQKDHKVLVREFLQVCRERKITLNPNKMLLGQREVKFAGYIVGRDGIKADPEKIIAIKNFPKPKNLTDLRSFQGLVEQLGGFSSDVAEAMTPLRPLMSPKAEFIWNEDHEKAFEAAKLALSKPPILTTFDPKRETRLETDAARTKGSGTC